LNPACFTSSAHNNLDSTLSFDRALIVSSAEANVGTSSKGAIAFFKPHLGTGAIVKIYTFLNGKYLFDNIYNNYIILVGLKTGYTISKLLDKGIIELIGPFGLTEGSYLASYNLSKLDTGVITTYALYITLGLISILFVLFSITGAFNL
jgi:NADH:ubiquinone oxidoreductase subunit 5 (subunit L)/multisubunit Na+/H+ antiporter MnhA subunit